MPASPQARDRWLAFSRGLAWVFGVATPLGETIRRWDALTTTYAPSWLDDYCVGAFLLFGAWATRTGAADPARGRRWLAAAWGFACGMGYCSFFGNLRDVRQPDPSGWVPHWAVVAIVGAGTLLAALALVAAACAPSRPPAVTSR